jgi:hypothetical protein
MENNLPQNQMAKASDEISVRDITHKVLRVLAYWPFILVSVIAGFFVAFFVNRYSENNYVISSLIAIEQAENPLSGLSEGIMNFDFGGSSGLVETRVAVLKSYAHNLKVAQSLGWEVSYFSEGRIKRREAYRPAEISVELDLSMPQLLGVEYEITPSANSFEVVMKSIESPHYYNYALQTTEALDQELTGGELDGTYPYGEWIEGVFGKFRVVKGKLPEVNSNNVIYFSLQTYQAIAERNINRITIDSDGKSKSSLLTLSMEGNIKPKLADYLNQTIEQLQVYELAQKNLMAINTIAFIDQQIASIGEDLQNSESALQDFRAENLIVDLTVESEQILTYFIELEQSRGDLNLQRTFYQYVLQ